MKKFFVFMVGMVLVLGFSGLASAIDDSGDTPFGPNDIISAEAEIYEARDDVDLLKISVEATPALNGVLVFEADVDNSAGTGGSISTIGAPVAPCPCKVEPGFDVAVAIMLRQQGDTSGSAVAASCSDGLGDCGRRREAGEWYAILSSAGQPQRAIGILRGITDPIPGQAAAASATTDAYTLPWSYIIAYANQQQVSQSPGDPGNFDFNPGDPNYYANGKWQISLFYDADADTTDKDDVADGVTAFNINDWAPDVGKADMLVSGGASDLTYCEGNFDGDKDVDGGDAAKFKANFGRSGFSNPCPPAGPNY